MEEENDNDVYDKLSLKIKLLGTLKIDILLKQYLCCKNNTSEKL